MLYYGYSTQLPFQITYASVYKQGYLVYLNFHFKNTSTTNVSIQNIITLLNSELIPNKNYSGGTTTNIQGADAFPIRVYTTGIVMVVANRVSANVEFSFEIAYPLL